MCVSFEFDLDLDIIVPKCLFWSSFTCILNNDDASAPEVNRAGYFNTINAEPAKPEIRNVVQRISPGSTTNSHTHTTKCTSELCFYAKGNCSP